MPTVEVRQFPGSHVDRADRQADSARIDAVEIDEPLQRIAQRGRVVDRVLGADAGREEAGHAELRRAQRASLLIGGAPGAGGWGGQLAEVGRNEIPELAQALDPPLRRIARDERGIEGPDRHADEPVRRVAELGKRLVHACLVRAERTAALQRQRDALVALVE